MYKTYELKIKDIGEANIEALRIAKDILAGKVEITPYIVAEFTALSGFNDVEVFIRTAEREDEPFNNDNDYDYEENIYYYLYETGDIVRVTFEEFERLLKRYVEVEIDVFDNEKEELRGLIKDLEN
jgi:hypothetical protein